MTKSYKELHMRLRVENYVWFYNKEDFAPLTTFLCDLVDSLGMKRLGGPYCDWLDRKNLKGWSAQVHIETSNICIHHFAEHGYIQVDVFTCGTLDKEVVFRAFDKFVPERIIWDLYDRAKGFDKLSEGTI